MNDDSKKETIGALGMFLAVYPNYALAHKDLGVLYYGEGEKEKALGHYEEAARLEPQNHVFQKNLADFYYVEQRRVEEAMKLYVKVLGLNPTDIETLLILGHICVSLEKFDDAEVFYNRVLELEPWNIDARERLDELGKGQMSEVGGQVSEDRYQRTPRLNTLKGPGSTGQGGWKSKFTCGGFDTSASRTIRDK
jgi:tetratricopeptide (TPR) repeat protein